MVNEGEDQHENVDLDVVSPAEDQHERTDSEINQTTGERFFNRHSGIIVLVVAALAFANYVVKDIFGDQAKEIADSVNAAEGVFTIRQDLAVINKKVTGVDNLARSLITDNKRQLNREGPDEKARVVGKKLPTLKRKDENEHPRMLYEFAMLDLGFFQQQRRITLVTLDNIARLMNSFADPKLEEQVSSVRAELEQYDKAYKDLRQDHSQDDAGVFEATGKLVMGLQGVELQLDTLQGEALDSARKEEEAKDTRYRILRNVGYVLYGLVAVIVILGKHYKYDWA